MIKLVIFDLDGCLTDGKLTNELILNSKDTWGLKKLNNNNIKTAIISNSSKIIDNDLLKDRIDVIYTQVKNKVNKFESLLKELNIHPEEVAYIGDDERDIEILEKVNISFTPKDSLVKKHSKYISKYMGGDGAVRELCDLVLKYNNRFKKKIVAVIGVRSGSVRCKNKNIKDFGKNDNLLTKKLEILSNIEEISKIIVSSDSEEYLEISSKYKKVHLDKRPDYYASNNLNGKELFNYLGHLINDDEIFMYSPVVSPFISEKEIIDCINTYKKEINYDSVCTGNIIKEFIWFNGKPLNYDYYNAPKSQDLPEYIIPTLGVCLIEKDILIKNNNIIGNNPYFKIIDKIKSIDIDDNFDFELSKLLNMNSIESEDDFFKKKNINLLDCTIRDGGYRNNWNFSKEYVKKLYKVISNSNIEYFEIGFRKEKDITNGKWAYSSDSDILDIRKSYLGTTPSKIAVMVKYGDYKLKDLESKCIDMFRILIKSGKLDENHNNFIIESIKKLNYENKEVALNIPYGHKIDDSLEKLISKIFEHNLKVKVFYIADTFGSMNERSILNSYKKIENFLKKYTKNYTLGFHSHANNSDELNKTLFSLNKIYNIKYIDSCISGMGRGVGNLKTEDIVSKLNQNFNKKYHIMNIYKYCFELGNEKILYKLTADNEIHPNYVEDFIKMNLTFKEVMYKIEEISDNGHDGYKPLV